MHLAISGTEFSPEEPIGELLSSAHTLQIEAIELWFPRNTSCLGLDATVRAIERSNLKVCCVSTGSELYRNGGSLEDQALLLKAIDLARDLEAPFVNTYFGYAAERDDARAIRIYAEYLQPCLEAASQSGITIVLENEFNAFGVDPSRSDITRTPLALRALFEEVDHPAFRLTFDPANFYCAGVEPFPDAYNILAPYISYCHVKDCEDVPPQSRDEGALGDWRLFSDYDNSYVTTPLGLGKVPWKEIITQLLSDRYPGYLTLEPHSLPQFREHAWKQAITYLRPILD